MKVIIAEKPSVAREIARVVRATNKKDGYIEGGSYAVTWALGHLITAAMPEAYGIKGFHKENLPILPPVFTLIPRQMKEGKGYKADAVAVAQLKVIEKLFRECEGIIVATDAGREGELIFRFIYEYLGIHPVDMYKDEAVIYDMIAGRMLEVFSARCVKDVSTVTAVCEGVKFILKGEIIKEEGWRAVLKNSRKKDKEQAEAEEQESRENGEGIIIPQWEEGKQLPLCACSLAQGTTKPKPLHTESSLLAAMENPCQREQTRTCSGMPSTAGFRGTQTAGRELEDEELRAQLKECGIGTPATRAAIIETLFAREYMVRQKKSLVPTEKGLAVYSIVREMKIGNAEMTGQWEADLARIERGELKERDFRKGIESYATQITDELLSSKILFPKKQSDINCPKCGKGSQIFYPRCAKCSDADCGLTLFRSVAGKSLTDEQLTQLAVNGETGIIKGFTSKAGKSFEASLSLDGEFKTVFVFPERKKPGKSRR